MPSAVRYGARKVREGTVVSDKMQKTVVVAVEAHYRHPLYKKTVRRVRRYMAHDEADECRVGDRVRIVESRPLSRRKRWRVVEVLARAELPELAAERVDLELLGEAKEAEEPPAEAPITAPEGPPAEEEVIPSAGPPPEPQQEEVSTEAQAEEVPPPEEPAPTAEAEPAEEAAQPSEESEEESPSEAPAGADEGETSEEREEPQ